jgi:D-glycero-beta-D-manno-heptose-7-phosphate kinase
MTDLRDIQRRMTRIDVGAFARVSVTVLGDIALDHYLVGTTARVSREAPVLVLEHEQDEYRPGSAGNTVANLVALGCDVRVVGWVGDDFAGSVARQRLAELGADTSGIVTVAGATTCTKTRIVARAPQAPRQQLMRVDRLAAPPTEETRVEMRRRLAGSLSGAHAVVLSDYAGTTIDAAMLDEVAAVPIRVADSRHRLPAFVGVTAATPNVEEAAEALDWPADCADGAAVASVACELRRRLRCEAMLVTRGPHGMTLAGADGTLDIAAHRRADVYDVTGAGDTVVAVFTAALACGGTYAAAAELANLAGSLAVQKPGATAIDLGALRELCVAVR